TRYAMQAPHIHQSLSQLEDYMANGQFEASPAGYDDASCCSLPMTSYPQQFANNAFGGGMQDFNNSLDPMDLEFSKFIQVTT
ncbi:hypothetical protein B0A55_07249, partial [Friedmanniomyces simplex]